MLIRSFDIFFKRLFILLLLIAFCYVLYLTRMVIVPFVAAFILAYLLNPIVTTLQKHMSRFTAILIVYTMAIALLSIIMRWAVPAIWAQLQTIWNYLPTAIEWYNTTGREWLGKYTDDELLVLNESVVREHITAYLQTNYQISDAQSILMKIMSSGLSVINVVGLLALIPILTFYFLMNWRARLDMWLHMIPKPWQSKTIVIARDCDIALMSFVKGQLLVMILLGLVYAVQLQLIGLNVGLIIGMIAGIASFVPYLGFGIGIIAAVVAGFFQFGLDWVKLGMIVGAFMVGQAVEGYLLQPLLLGDKIGLSPLWVIFAVLAGASLFGFVGMLIALPLAAVINVLFHHALDAYKNSEYYKGRRQYTLF